MAAGPSKLIATAARSTRSLISDHSDLPMRNAEFGMRNEDSIRIVFIPHSAFRSIQQSALLLTVSDPGLIRCQIWGFLESSNSARDPDHFRTGHRMVFLGSET